MKVKYLLVIFLLSICFSQAYAQWDAQISQYWRIKTYFNPSFAGETDDLQAVILHRQQWVGIENAPKTLIISADMPLKFMNRVHGVGAVMMSESIGLFTNSLMGGQYVYKKRFKKNLLNIGVQAGLARITFDASGVIAPSEDPDEAIPTNSEQNSSLDANLGISWVNPKYYAGLSVTHLSSPTFKTTQDSSSYINRVYYFTAGYNIQFRNPLYELQPSVLIKSDALFVQYDVTARIVYNKMFNGGISWRKDDGFVFLLGVRYKGIDAGYAYDLSTSAIKTVSSGTHEFFVRYAMPIKLNKTEKNSQKSVRIL